jgi:hypothetical protein
VALAFFAGCELPIVHVHAINAGAQLKAVPEKQVKLYAGEPPRPPAVVLGSVALDVIGDGDDAAAEARRVFGELGADAIIHVRLTKLTGYVLRTGLSGLAVRMTP